MHEILVGTSILAAFVGGMVALFAPCCISVMLPGGPDGRVRWRADYGGAPDYTMFVKVSELLEDMGAAQARTS